VFVFVFSLGYLTVLPAKNPYVRWSEPNLSRLSKGKLALGPDRTAIVGLVSWIIVIICQGVVAKTAGHGVRKSHDIVFREIRRGGAIWGQEISGSRGHGQIPPQWMGMDARQSKVGCLETLVAVAIAIGILKGHAAPAAAPPQTVTVEPREPRAPKPPPRHRAEPSLGF
jgi:hypothetical protein